MSSSLILRLGSHSERDYLLKTLDLFTGTIIGANLLETTPGATVSLSWKILSKNKKFLIDPMTYLFALDPSYISSDAFDKKAGVAKRELKKSFKSMCQELGEPFLDIVLNQRRSLRPADFSSDHSIAALCQCVAHYQLTRMKKICAKDPQLQDFSDEANVSAVLAPYFFIPAENNSGSQEWEDVCLRVIKHFGAMDIGVPKHAVLCISRSTLKVTSRLIGMLEKVKTSGCDCCWLWVSNFREEDVTDAEMHSLILATKRAASLELPLWNMHGGFLSALLSKIGMCGFSHSVGYGESKDVLPVSGGALPTVSFHYNPLHVKASVPDIVRAFSSVNVSDAQSFHERICDCVMCKGTLNNKLQNFSKYGELVLKPNNKKMSQTADSAKRCRFHFLLARKKELELVNAKTLPELLISLRSTVAEYRSLSSSIRLRDRAAGLEQWVKYL